MTPFADYLFQLRRSRGLRQRELAERLGLGASYISSLEACRKEPPTTKQLNRLSHVLGLSVTEAAALLRAAELSRSRIDIPSEASKDEFVLMHELAEHLGSLTANQVEIIRMILRMKQEEAAPPATPCVALMQRENAM